MGGEITISWAHKAGKSPEYLASKGFQAVCPRENGVPKIKRVFVGTHTSEGVNHGAI
jgi:hypothetical protein